jgi:two-component system sensor histidine kinase KdpD
VGTLTALRELALLWLAGRVEEGLQRYRAEHEIHKVWETHERVVVALTGRTRGRDADPPSRPHRRPGRQRRPAGRARRAQRQLVESLGGSYHSVVGDDVPLALLDFARAANATQLVFGTSRRGALRRALTAGRGIGETTVVRSNDRSRPDQLARMVGEAMARRAAFSGPRHPGTPATQDTLDNARRGRGFMG